MFKDLQYLNRFPISKKRKVINSVGQRMCDGLYEEIGGQADWLSAEGTCSPFCSSLQSWTGIREGLCIRLRLISYIQMERDFPSSEDFEAALYLQLCEQLD